MLLLLACAAAFALGGFGLFTVGKALQAPYTQAQKDLAAIKAGDLQGVYDSATPEFRAGSTFDDFKGFVDQHPVLKDWTSHSGFDVHIDNGIATVKLTLTGASGSETFDFLYAPAGKDIWKLNGIQIGKPDTGSSS